MIGGPDQLARLKQKKKRGWNLVGPGVVLVVLVRPPGCAHASAHEPALQVWGLELRAEKLATETTKLGVQGDRLGTKRQLSHQVFVIAAAKFSAHRFTVIDCCRTARGLGQHTMHLGFGIRESEWPEAAHDVSKLPAAAP